MLSKEEISRYSRHLLLDGFGREAQEKLKAARVLVIGAGGLGCPVLSYLVAAGVGTIGIADGDIVEESNLQRQVLFSVDDIGRPKAACAAEKLSRQNPFVHFRVHPRIENHHALELFRQYDLVIDGTDNFSTRYLVNDACVLLDKTLVHGSIHRFEGQVSVFNFHHRDGSYGPTYRCLFPSPPAPSAAPSCAQAGVLGVLPGIIGSLQANEAIKIITGMGEVLSGKLLLVDALAMNFLTLAVQRNEAWKTVAPATEEAFLKTDYPHYCGSKEEQDSNRLSAAGLRALLVKEELVLLDVRERNEQPIIEELKGIHIPLGELPAQLHLVPKEKKVVVFCRSGVRSQRAIALLREKGFSQLYHLEGGIQQWLLQEA